MKFLPLVVLLFLAQLATSQSNNAAQVARGRYLVRNVGMCGDCHTPRDEKGTPGRELSGSLLGFKPLAPMPWAATAPEIAGLPGWKEDEIVKFLMTGKLNGKDPQPPMPGYRLSVADAKAVVAYLKSLGKSESSPNKKAAPGK